MTESGHAAIAPDGPELAPKRQQFGAQILEIVILPKEKSSVSFSVFSVVSSCVHRYGHVTRDPLFHLDSIWKHCKVRHSTTGFVACGL